MDGWIGCNTKHLLVLGVSEKATSNKIVSEDWALIMEICDKVGSSPQHAKDCLRSIVKRLNNPDPHIVILAITVSEYLDCHEFDLLFMSID